MTNNQKLRRELDRHIDKALGLAYGQKAQVPKEDYANLPFDTEDKQRNEQERISWGIVIDFLQKASLELDQASFMSDEREAYSG